MLTPELLTTVVSHWEAYENAAVQYVDSILGIQTPTTASLSIAISQNSEKDFKSMDFGTPNDADSSELKRFFELQDDPKFRALMEPTTEEDRVEKLKFLLPSTLDDMFFNAIKAPFIALTTNRQSLNHSAASYRQAADIMQ